VSSSHGSQPGPKPAERFLGNRYALMASKEGLAYLGSKPNGTKREGFVADLPEGR